MPSPAETYLSTATVMLQRACAANAPVLKTLGGVIGESLARGGVLHTFGSGHTA